MPDCVILKTSQREASGHQKYRCFSFLKKKPPNCEGGGFEVNMIFDVFVWESGVARLLMLSILNRSGGVRKCEIR